MCSSLSLCGNENPDLGALLHVNLGDLIKAVCGQILLGHNNTRIIELHRLNACTQILSKYYLHDRGILMAIVVPIGY